MYKKKQFSKLEKKYNKYQDEGTVGFMMKLCHQNLEKDLNIMKDYKFHDNMQK